MMCLDVGYWTGDFLVGSKATDVRHIMSVALQSRLGTAKGGKYNK